MDAESKQNVEKIKAELYRLNQPGVILENKQTGYIMLFWNGKYIPDTKMPDNIDTFGLSDIDHGKLDDSNEQYEISKVNLSSNIQQKPSYKDENKDLTERANNDYIPESLVLNPKNLSYNRKEE